MAKHSVPMPCGILLALALAITPARAASPAKLILIKAIHITPSPVVDYKPAAISIQVLPGVACSARVSYLAGGTHATSHSLKKVTSAIQGKVVLRWTPETKYPGKARAAVHCTADKLAQDQVVAFVVAPRR